MRISDWSSDVCSSDLSAMSVPVRTDIADPLDRLAAIRDYTVEAKEAKAGVSARLMTDLSQHFPGATMAAFARILTTARFAVRGTNLFISHVPGQHVPLYLADVGRASCRAGGCQYF